jgi:hypothetical protein
MPNTNQIGNDREVPLVSGFGIRVVLKATEPGSEVSYPPLALPQPYTTLPLGHRYCM